MSWFNILISIQLCVILIYRCIKSIKKCKITLHLILIPERIPQE